MPYIWKLESVAGKESGGQFNTQSALYLQAPHSRIQPSANWNYLQKKEIFPKSSKTQNFNLECDNNNLYNIYFV